MNCRLYVKMTLPSTLSAVYDECIGLGCQLLSMSVSAQRGEPDSCLLIYVCLCSAGESGSQLLEYAVPSRRESTASIP